MAFIFFDELGVEPLAYIGVDTSLTPVIFNSIHKQYVVIKTDLIIEYVCGRYVNTKKDNRIINTYQNNRFVQSPLLSGKC